MDGFVTNVKIDSRIKSYIPKKEYGTPLSFEEIAKNSCNGGDIGVKALGIIKADVDNMGNYIKNSDITKNFANFDEFSKGLDSFFSIYVPKLLREKYRNIYIVFAGGDDLFLIGAWDEVMSFSREIRNIFKEYVKDDHLTISFGISIAKPSTPVSYLANHTESLLENSKEIEGKNALTLWGETVKWESYLSSRDALWGELTKLKEDDSKMTLYYRLLDFAHMGKRIEESTVDGKTTLNEDDLLWKSKLAYSFHRNMSKAYEPLLQVLNTHIQSHPKETIMVLSEYIYTRRRK